MLAEAASQGAGGAAAHLGVEAHVRLDSAGGGRVCAAQWGSSGVAAASQAHEAQTCGHLGLAQRTAPALPPAHLRCAPLKVPPMAAAVCAASFSTRLLNRRPAAAATVRLPVLRARQEAGQWQEVRGRIPPLTALQMPQRSVRPTTLAPAAPTQLTCRVSRRQKGCQLAP